MLTKTTNEDKVLPETMMALQTLIDPFNGNNYYIFGSLQNNKCWYFNHKTQTFKQIDDIPKDARQNSVSWHNSAMFETTNDNKYALIYGGVKTFGSNATYNIYNFKMKTWDDNAVKLNNQWFDNQNIMKDGGSMYSFGKHVLMITDLFEKNKIHIVGGHQFLTKYGYFEFNQQILNDPNLSFVGYAKLRGWFECAKLRNATNTHKKKTNQR